MERFIAILLEHTAGNFPLWLMPEQIILSLSEKYEIYAKKVLDLLENNEIRALVDNRNETIGKKIRDAEMQKSVYADCREEEKNGTISIRRHGQEGKGNISVTIEEFAEIVDAEIKRH
jgi:threonyl-tRNA synthetase